MATIDYDPLNEEENFTSGSLNTRFTELAGSLKGVNALPVSAIAPKSLLHHQVPSLVPTQDITSSPSASDHGQSRSWTVELHPTGSKVYTGSAVQAVTGGSAQELRIDFPSGIKLGMGSGTDGVKGLLVLANVHVMSMLDLSSSSPQFQAKHTILFGIQVDVGSSTWVTIPRTRRVLSQTLMSLDNHVFNDNFTESTTDDSHAMRFDVPLRSLISAQDIKDALSSANITIYGVRVVCWASTDGHWADGGDFQEWSTRAANLSVIPFHAGGTLV